MRYINLLPPMNSYQKHIYITRKVAVDCVQDVHDFIIDNISDKAKDDTNMFSMIHTESLRYKQEFTTGIWGVCLDIDDGITFNEVKNKLDKLKLNYLMYNTHSNSKNGNDRFRCVIVLDKIYSKEDFTLAKPILKKKFIKMFSIDSSTLDINRRFIFPPTKCEFNLDLPPLIVSKVKGKLLNIDKAVEMGKKYEISKRRFEKIENKPTFEKSIKGLESYIQKIEWTNGEKHNNLVYLIHKFKADGFSFTEIKQAVDKNTSFKIDWNLLDNLR